MRAFCIGFVSLFALLGCTADTLVSSAYPDREVLKFRSSNGEDVHSYACEKGPSVEATKARAAKAHRFFDARINAVAERFANEMIAGIDAGSEPDITALTSQLNEGAEKASEDTEKRFQCLFFDAQET